MKSSNIFWYAPTGGGYCTTCAMTDPEHPCNNNGDFEVQHNGYIRPSTHWVMVDEHHDHFGAVECELCGLIQAYHNEPQMRIVLDDDERFGPEVSNQEKSDRLQAKYGTTTLSRPQVQAEFHWYASSGLNWAVGTDILEALEKCKLRDIGQSGKLSKSGKRDWEIEARVFRVPGPVTREYKINNYVPVVDGLEYIETVSY